MTADFRGAVTCLIDTQVAWMDCARNPEIVRRGGRDPRTQGQCKRSDRPPSQGTGCVGSVRPASFSSGL
jgi:hypothetical protein